MQQRLKKKRLQSVAVLRVVTKMEFAMSFTHSNGQMKQAWQFETVGGCMHALHAALAF